MKNLILLLISCFIFSKASFAEPACQPRQYHSQAKVKQVIDGDTIQLQSGQLVRLIGINTPEIDHKNADKTEPFAEQAKQYVEDLIGQSQQINLVLDKELVDPYNRMLAHIFNLKGENIQQKLVAKGFADASVYGENTLFWQCYYHAELAARQDKLGIWQTANYQPRPISRLYKSYSYPYEWQGKLDRVFVKNDTLWLVLGNKLYVGVTEQDQYQVFNQIDFKSLIGQTLYIKAPVYYQDKHWRADLTKLWQLIIDTDINPKH
ncbi:thermonuclease family protein [Catenovulum sp. 2E275]|uniref:thermonuclease family protein n=1 Tax=Catenovulum sp. 2E275 TaxID=2980497 RepID=UPI0021D1D543|nr:thermonuclease family protein [Catenovulum sp. 2E275]MCU4676315.1 thermonuclease family protein [Catenovulum sp. 2E275]